MSLDDGIISTGRRLIEDLKQVRSKASSEDQAVLNWGVGVLQAKLAEDERFKASQIQENLGVILNLKECASLVASAVGYEQVGQLVLERLAKPLLKEAYVWQDCDIIYTCAPRLKSGVSYGLSISGQSSLTSSIFEGCTTWAEKSSAWFAKQGKTDFAYYYLEFSKAMRFDSCL